MSLLVARYFALTLPIVAVLLAVWRTRPDRRTRGAALLALVAAGTGIAALNAVAGALGWWSFAPVEGSHLGVPVDLWLGWSLLWGALPVLARARLPMTLAALLWVDVVVMPELAPLVRLGPNWLAGEAIGIVAVAAPAILLGRWVADGRALRRRAALQVLTFGGILLWLAPATAIDLGDGSWTHLATLSRWQLSLVVQTAALIALPGVLAVREFVERGDGTPYPWDPPGRLVTTGPYAYLANPMQLSAVGLLVLAAVVTRSWAVAVAAFLGAFFSVAVAGPHEHDDLTRRHGAAWTDYRARVRPWWPRWRPDVLAPARLYLAGSCDVCSSAAAALARQHSTGLDLLPAEQCVEHLVRARYAAPDGYRADGVAAVARGMEHVNLGWAAAGWILRIPLFDRLVQVIVDGMGGGPRALAQAATDRPEEAPGWRTPGRS